MKRCECGQYPDVCARYGHASTHDRGQALDVHCTEFGHRWVMSGHRMLVCSRCGMEMLDHVGPDGSPATTMVLPRQNGKNERMQEFASDDAKTYERTWMEEHAPEVLEEEERQELREELLRQQAKDG